MPRQIFLHEVERQCKFALMAYEDLEQALAASQQRAPAQPESNCTYADDAQVQAAMTLLGKSVCLLSSVILSCK